ncbi:putative bifunctional diguanylate cyclase/phosphodiesterase [Actinoplanes sp. CA-030573]|uniref:putative bifunctional diguanylate cyclase/phosphodiesterase n=1 Tax=Actinoplanes sp. CA-030573 TaxID=3239898 RepID=UPI003D935752
MNHWSTHQLTEFFAAVCEARDERLAAMVAIERASEVLETEVGAVLSGDRRVEVAWGVRGDVLEDALGSGPAATVEVPGLDELFVAEAGFGGGDHGRLMVARAGEALGPEERQLLQAMAQTLGLALANIRLLQAERRALESLREARHDSLTGLPTRVLFLEKLEETVREPAPASVLFIDLDRFKAVNDSLGHRAGDELLGLVAARIRHCLRPGDVGARIGGDEFAVLLHDTATDEAVPIAERLIDAVRRPFRVAGRDVFIGASIGVATRTDTAPADAGDLLGNADVAMYQAKTDGPGKVVVFAPHMHAEALARLTLNADLQRALAGDEFRLQYQPLIRLADGAMAGVEALVRWDKPDGVRALPADFLPMAEETGLVIDLGRWVLHRAGEQAARWRRTMPGLVVSVNVSGRQLADPGFAPDVRGMLADCGLPPSAVTLELTESVLMNDPATAIAHLAELKAIGVGLSIDDFGTGYSSLSLLQRLPVDELKIDRSFMGHASPTVEDVAVIRAVVELARTLRLRTVIEGVETAAQLTAMRRLGCDLGQGYHLGRPADPERLFAGAGRPRHATPNSSFITSATGESGRLRGTPSTSTSTASSKKATSPASGAASGSGSG